MSRRTASRHRAVITALFRRTRVPGRRTDRRGLDLPPTMPHNEQAIEGCKREPFLNEKVAEGARRKPKLSGSRIATGRTSELYPSGHTTEQPLKKRTL